MGCLFVIKTSLYWPTNFLSTSLKNWMRAAPNYFPQVKFFPRLITKCHSPLAKFWFPLFSSILGLNKQNKSKLKTLNQTQKLKSNDRYPKKISIFFQITRGVFVDPYWQPFWGLQAFLWTKITLTSPLPNVLSLYSQQYVVILSLTLLTSLPPLTSTWFDCLI